MKKIKDNIDNENDVSTWSLKKCKEWLSKINFPKSGYKKELQKWCVLWMIMTTMGNSMILKMELHELEVQSQLLHVGK